MHSFEHKGVTILHNNSIRSTGDVHLQKERGAGFSCPQEALIAFVAQLVARERVSELEQAEPLEVFGLGRALPKDLREAIVKACAAMGDTADVLTNSGSLDEARSELAGALARAEGRRR